MLAGGFELARRAVERGGDDGVDWWSIIAIVLSALAIVLTALQFYVTRLKRGRLELVDEPPSYGLAPDTRYGPVRTRMHIPLTVRNDGAKVAVLSGVRFAFGTGLHPTPHVQALFICSSIDPRDGAAQQFFQPVPIEGQTTRVVIVGFDFVRDPTTIAAGDYKVVVERLECGTWVDFGEFTLRVTPTAARGFGTPNPHWNAEA